MHTTYKIIDIIPKIIYNQTRKDNVMEINEIPKGQLPTIILTTLLSGDKYGYEIISEVESKTNGEVIIKKPSLYSSLSRMENQDLVSSYWKDSEIGGRRHYYRLTDYGRKQVLQWQEDLLLSQSNVSKMIETKPKIEKPTSLTEIQEQPVSEPVTRKDVFAQQENLFDALSDSNQQTQMTLDKPEEVALNDKKDVFLQYDLFNSNFISTPADESPSLRQQPYVFNMSAFDGTQNQEQNQTLIQPVTNQTAEIPDHAETEYVNKDNISIEDILNARVEDKLSNLPQNQSSVKVEIGDFDIENELNNYKKNYTSYSESTKNQNSTAVYDFVHTKPSTISKEPEIVQDESENEFTDKEHVNGILDNDSIQEENKIHDDAVFITDELNEEDFKVKKIPPAIFHTIPLKQQQEEPQYTPVANEEPTVQSATETYYENYDQLKKYYSKLNVNLKVYNDKSSDIAVPAQSEIKINKFKFLNYLIFFLLSCAEIITCYFVLKRYNLLSSNNYLYYYISLLTLITLPLIFYAIKLATNPNKKIAKQSVNLNPLWFKVCLILLSAGIIYSLNMLFSMTTANWKYYISTLILPVCILVNSLITHLSKSLMLKDNNN